MSSSLPSRAEIHPAQRESCCSDGRMVSFPDDDVVIDRAVAGGATHLVTYDDHLHALGEEVEGVRILDGLHFLYVLRGDVPLPR